MIIGNENSWTPGWTHSAPTIVLASVEPSTVKLLTHSQIWFHRFLTDELSLQCPSLQSHILKKVGSFPIQILTIIGMSRTLSIVTAFCRATACLTVPATRDPAAASLNAKFVEQIS